MKIKLITFLSLAFFCLVVQPKELSDKTPHIQNISGLIQGANVLIEDPLGHKIGRLGNDPVAKEITSGNDLYIYHAESTNAWELGINRPLPGIYKVTFEGTGDSVTYGAVTPDDYFPDIYETEIAFYDTDLYGVLAKGVQKTYEIFIPPYPGIIGDVNNDGDITNDDLRKLEDNLKKTTDNVYAVENLFVNPGDLNKDGLVNDVDRELLKILVINYQSIKFK